MKKKIMFDSFFRTFDIETSTFQSILLNKLFDQPVLVARSQNRIRLVQFSVRRQNVSR